MHVGLLRYLTLFSKHNNWTTQFSWVLLDMIYPHKAGFIFDVFLHYTSDCLLQHMELIGNGPHWFFRVLVNDKLDLLDEVYIPDIVWRSRIFFLLAIGNIFLSEAWNSKWFENAAISESVLMVAKAMRMAHLLIPCIRVEAFMTGLKKKDF